MTLPQERVYLKARNRYWEMINREEEVWEDYLKSKVDRQAHIATCMCREYSIIVSKAYERAVDKCS